MASLHSAKINDEKNAYISELFQSLPQKEEILDGTLSSRANTLHKILLPIYIMKYYRRKSFLSPYLDVIITNIIEGESLLILGFRNSGMSALRSALETSFKFLYYEYHPIENTLHLDNLSHLLNSSEYREFLYKFPGLSKISFLSKANLETLWKELCRYVHCDIRVLSTLTVVSQISSLLQSEMSYFNKIMDQIKYIVKIIIAIFFAIDSSWAKEVEKAYFDAILEAFSIEEKNEVLNNLRIE